MASASPMPRRRTQGARRSTLDIQLRFDTRLSEQAIERAIEQDVAATNRGIVAACADHGVRAYQGFYEDVHRLLFAYEDRFADDDRPEPPQLAKITPAGVLETHKFLMPRPGKAIVGYPYTQDLQQPLAADAALRADAHTWTRADGSRALVQCWTTAYDDEFRASFTVHTHNPDPAIYDPRAVAEFERCCRAVFGDDATKRVPTRYCHRRSINVGSHPVYVGEGAALLALLRASPEIREALGIVTVTAEGFSTTHTTPRTGEVGTLRVALAPEQTYALHAGRGWHTMACATPLEQFARDRELFGLMPAADPPHRASAAPGSEFRHRRQSPT